MPRPQHIFRTKEGKEINRFLKHTSRALKPGDIIIPVLGPAGSGKSTLINQLLAPDAPKRAGINDNGIPVCTTTCDLYIQDFPSKRNLHFRRVEGRRLVIVDTPGVPDCGMSDEEVIEELISAARPISEKQSSLAGLVLVFPLSSPGRHAVNQEACPSKRSLLRLSLATTKWKNNAEDKGLEREKELRKALWGDSTNDSLLVRCQENDPLAAWALIDSLMARFAASRGHTPVSRGVNAARLARWLASMRIGGLKLKENGPAEVPRCTQIRIEARNIPQLTVPIARVGSQQTSTAGSDYMTPPTSPTGDVPSISLTPAFLSGSDPSDSGSNGRLSFVEVKTDNSSSRAEDDPAWSEDARSAGNKAACPAALLVDEGSDGQPLSNRDSGSWSEGEQLHYRESGSWDIAERPDSWGDDWRWESPGESEDTGQALMDSGGVMDEEVVADIDTNCNEGGGSSTSQDGDGQSSTEFEEDGYYSGTEVGEYGAEWKGAGAMYAEDAPQSSVFLPLQDPHFQNGSATSNTAQSQQNPVIAVPVSVPRRGEGEPPPVITISFPPEFIRQAREARESVPTPEHPSSSGSTADHRSAPPSDLRGASGNGTDFFGGANHFGVRNMSIVNVNVTVKV
ncbi:hypothetical protein D9611_013932 [Ephemerocybe angulata]|uniref:G domain-containing protein n=1 Tax=Ephemerocybe angulata TaxID=980116 RepID=A0A8H5BA41_9AGAR|nr:hypothetical protein D9611_013932 [Tulosesus angulatus]